MHTYVLVLLLCGRLVIEVGGSPLRWSLGFVGWARWHLGIDEIERIEARRSRHVTQRA